MSFGGADDGRDRTERKDRHLAAKRACWVCLPFVSIYIVHSGPSPRIPLDCELLNGWQCAGDATHGVLNSHLQRLNCERDHFRHVSQAHRNHIYRWLRHQPLLVLLATFSARRTPKHKLLVRDAVRGPMSMG